MDVSYAHIEVTHTHDLLFVFGFVSVTVLDLLVLGQIEVYLLQSLRLGNYLDLSHNDGRYFGSVFHFIRYDSNDKNV